MTKDTAQVLLISLLYQDVQSLCAAIERSGDSLLHEIIGNETAMASVRATACGLVLGPGAHREVEGGDDRWVMMAQSLLLALLSVPESTLLETIAADPDPSPLVLDLIENGRDRAMVLVAAAKLVVNATRQPIAIH